MKMKRLIPLLIALSAGFSVSAYAEDFYRGGDITELSYIESLGGKYCDADGNNRDALDILAENGMNMARIRLTNNPGKGRGDGIYYLPEGFQDETDCLALAKRAKEHNMKIQFTFNYSDYWSNGSRQIIPDDWVKQIEKETGYNVKDADFLNKMTTEERAEIIDCLENIVYEYTLDIMKKLNAQGTLPEYVSLGNEIRGGLLFPFANTYKANMNRDRFELVFGDDKSDKDIICPEDWDSLARFINAGYKAVKEVSPESRIIIHLDDGSKVSSFTWYLDKLDAAGAKYDVIGASYYPAWSGNTIDTCVDFCNEITKQYDKDIMIMETGFNWNETIKDGSAGQLVDIEAYKEIFPPTQEGHYGYMKALFEGLRSVEGDRCLGALYWDPLMIHVEDENGNNLSGWAYREEDDGVEKCIVENTTLFDFDGKAIKSLEAYRDDMEENTVTVIEPQYDGNGRLTNVETEKTDIRNALEGYIWDGQMIDRK
ncbi:MAG: glycosyl hydrolase 53 family protein [bacterium]|nr:glycosyl hydrolase 53 family protein [bacterium]